MYKVAHLEIKTYAGTVPGASHYIARLRFGDEVDINVEHKLTARSAAKLNRDERRQGAFKTSYKAGQTSTRFEEREEAIRTGVAIFERELLPKGADLLLLGSRVVCDPLPVIAFRPGLADLAARLNEISEAADKNDRWEGDEARMQQLCDSWDSLMDKPKGDQQ